jgi:hypothetical protein
VESPIFGKVSVAGPDAAPAGGGLLSQALAERAGRARDEKPAPADEPEDDGPPPAAPWQLAKALTGIFGDAPEAQVNVVVKHAMEQGRVGSVDDFRRWLDKQVLLLGRNDRVNKNARWPQTPQIERLAQMLLRADGTRSTLNLDL